MAIKEKTWADYEVRSYGGDIRRVPRAELIQIVRKAAKAANQRLRRLEKAGETSGIYKLAMRDLKMKHRRRYAEHPEKLDLTALRWEYNQIRDFLSAKSSTVQGARDIRDKRYNTAVTRGFEGTPEQWDEMVRKYFTREMEKLFSSDQIYDAISSGSTDDLDAVIEMSRGRDSPLTKSEIFQTLMRRKLEKKRRK